MLIFWKVLSMYLNDLKIFLLIYISLTWKSKNLAVAKCWHISFKTDKQFDKELRKWRPKAVSKRKITSTYSSKYPPRVVSTKVTSVDRGFDIAERK